jgi:hypothetical protein
MAKTTMKKRAAARGEVWRERIAEHFADFLKRSSPIAP